MEGVERGVRDGGGLVGAAGRLPSPRLDRGLSADWKTCQVTLAPPPTLPPSSTTEESLKTT